MSPPEQVDAYRAAQWLTERLASLLQLDVDALETTVPFASLGMSSVVAVALAGEIEAHFGLSVPATALWEHPTIDSLAAFIARGTKA